MLIIGLSDPAGSGIIFNEGSEKLEGNKNIFPFIFSWLVRNYGERVVVLQFVDRNKSLELPRSQF